jgi:hypothetical protein
MIEGIQTGKRIGIGSRSHTMGKSSANADASTIFETPLIRPLTLNTTKLNTVLICAKLYIWTIFHLTVKLK